MDLTLGGAAPVPTRKEAFAWRPHEKGLSSIFFRIWSLGFTLDTVEFEERVNILCHF